MNVVAKSDSEAAKLPTEPCSVVWSRGHAFVRERGARWMGISDRGRPVVLNDAELDRRGWTLA
jgi:hypothetical protein